MRVTNIASACVGDGCGWAPRRQGGPDQNRPGKTRSADTRNQTQGKYLQDNYEGGATVEAAQPWDNNPFANCAFDLSSDDVCLTEWQNSHTGPYGEGAAPIGMLMRSSQAERDGDEADLFIFGAAGTVFRGYYPGYSVEQHPPTSWFWSVVKMQTRNQAGTVKLRSADPRDMPSIDFNFFPEGVDNDRDLVALREGIDMLMRVFDNATVDTPYAPLNVIEPVPETVARFSTEQAIMDETFSHHPTSSCRMGPAGDRDYCVDPEFRVNGVRGLRVVDASIFPRIPGGFPAAPTFMIAKKASELILQGLAASE